MVYCIWLSEQRSRYYRLPTEVEWEAAARGLESRQYAWGDDFDTVHTNTFETHLRRTSPVGVFPGGDTEAGIMDLTGNVWEWTISLFESYPYRVGDGREDPVIRFILPILRLSQTTAWIFII